MVVSVGVVRGAADRGDGTGDKPARDREEPGATGAGDDELVLHAKTAEGGSSGSGCRREVAYGEFDQLGVAVEPVDLDGSPSRLVTNS